MNSWDIFNLVLGAALGGVISWFVNKLFERKIHPVWHMRYEPIITPSNSLASHGLGFTFDGKQIEYLTVYTVYFWNCGKQAIRQDDIVSPLTIRTKDYALYAAKIDKQSVRTNNFQVKQVDDHTIQVHYDYIDAKQGAKIVLFTNAFELEHMDIEFAIIGAPITKRRNIKTDYRIWHCFRIVQLFFSMILSASFALSAYLYISDTHDHPTLSISMILIVIAVTAQFILLLASKYTKYLTNSERIPKSII